MIDPIMKKLLNSRHISSTKANICKKAIPDIKQELEEFDEVKRIEEEFKGRMEKLHSQKQSLYAGLITLTICTITLLVWRYLIQMGIWK